MKTLNTAGLHPGLVLLWLTPAHTDKHFTGVNQNWLRGVFSFLSPYFPCEVIKYTNINWTRHFLNLTGEERVWEWVPALLGQVAGSFLPVAEFWRCGWVMATCYRALSPQTTRKRKGMCTCMYETQCLHNQTGEIFMCGWETVLNPSMLTSVANEWFYEALAGI